MGANVSYQVAGEKAVKFQNVVDTSGNVQMVEMDEEDNSDYDAVVRHIEKWKELNDPDEHLDICFASITHLPLLPENLKSLSIKGSSVKEIPEGVLPETLEYLCVSHTPLTQLPTLPPKLKELYAIETYCETFPTFPQTLERVVCFYTPLTSLPDLPEGLIELNCNHGHVKKFPKLPSTLKIFEAEGCECEEIPEFPPNLETLHIRLEKIEEWPTNLPDSLKELEIYCPLVKSIPLLPPNLEVLDLTWNTALETLPPLPPKLKKLEVSRSGLKTLPLTLPDSLEFLDVSHSSLIELSSLPKSLKHLEVSNTTLTNLPTLPNSLEDLYVSETPLTHLPELKSTSLASLGLFDSKLETLPELPETLTSLWACRSSLKELPRLPKNLGRLVLKDSPLADLYNEDSKDENKEWLESFKRRHNAILAGEPEPNRITWKQFLEWRKQKEKQAEFERELEDFEKNIVVEEEELVEVKNGDFTSSHQEAEQDSFS